jgi:hypothetical protein
MFGTEAQKQKWLVPLARGEKLGAWALTEPNAGSDAAATRTTATRESECWVLNGAKTFITHGASADVMVVMALTDRTRGAKGISAFVVERGTPGFVTGRKEDKLGMRASETTEVRFEQCRVPADHLLGEPGQGFIQALQVLDAGRIGIAALARPFLEVMDERIDIALRDVRIGHYIMFGVEEAGFSYGFVIAEQRFHSGPCIASARNAAGTGRSWSIGSGRCGCRADKYRYGLRVSSNPRILRGRL